MTRTAIIAAMPGELMPLVRGWHHETRNRIDLWIHKQEGGEWIAACAGAGQAAATRALAEIEKDGPVTSVFSVGWAGALTETCTTGGVYHVSQVVDARTGERFDLASAFEPCALVTNPAVVDEPGKRRLAAAYSATLVDMEAAALARLAEMRGIPFTCIKGVSDAVDARLPDLNRFIAPDGRFRLTAFVLFAAIRPWYWPALLRMGENSKKAAQGIAQSLHQVLDARDHIRKPNGHSNLKP
jgi:adenosylhomocysteine nucleosidase